LFIVYRLQFPEKVLDDGSSCRYCADNGSYYVKVKKYQHGLEFKNLDLLKSILKPQAKSASTIEVLSGGEYMQFLIKFTFMLRHGVR